MQPITVHPREQAEPPITPADEDVVRRLPVKEPVVSWPTWGQTAFVGVICVCFPSPFAARSVKRET
ncbi:hypothetical protein [Streptomyces acidiscabies]|uniref:hypothetical protein n=1 Tax=Streptomyces acidiscabies TaxID=42234 RepID=UPI000951EAEF|nr:hypothetical protein [Streptomyces acidiscabies]